MNRSLVILAAMILLAAPELCAREETTMLKPTAVFALLVSFSLCPYHNLRAQEPASSLEFRFADDNETTGWQKMDIHATPCDAAVHVGLNG